MRPVSAGVYSAAQAGRGQQLYLAQCVDCHGKAMEGTIGPAMVGPGFLSNYSERPIVTLVDKIQSMPFNCPAAFAAAVHRPRSAFRPASSPPDRPS
jgi:mono/diheme cytochrome c family protein